MKRLGRGKKREILKGKSEVSFERTGSVAMATLLREEAHLSCLLLGSHQVLAAAENLP